MTARNSNGSGDGCKDFFAFDPTKWYTTEQLKRCLHVGADKLKDWKSQGLKCVRLKSDLFWGGDISDFLMNLRE